MGRTSTYGCRVRKSAKSSRIVLHRGGNLKFSRRVGSGPWVEWDIFLQKRVFSPLIFLLVQESLLIYLRADPALQGVSIGQRMSTLCKVTVSPPQLGVPAMDEHRLGIFIDAAGYKSYFVAAVRVSAVHGLAWLPGRPRRARTMRMYYNPATLPSGLARRS